jgi:hypothetical protein
MFLKVSVQQKFDNISFIFSVIGKLFFSDVSQNLKVMRLPETKVLVKLPDE